MLRLILMGLVIVLAGVGGVVEKRREPSVGSLRWVPYALILLAALGAFVPELFGYIDQARSERASSARHDELMRAGRSSGTLLPPTVGAQSDVMELTIGDNVLTCPAAYTVDLAQLLTRFAPFPLAQEGPYLKVVSGGDQLLVSATLSDKDATLLGVVHNNSFVFDPARPLSIERGPNRVTVRDTDGTVLLDVALTSARRATVRGVFYTPLYRCAIDDKGIVCDAVSDKAPIRQIIVAGNKFRVAPAATKPAE